MLQAPFHDRNNALTRPNFGAARAHGEQESQSTEPSERSENVDCALPFFFSPAAYDQVVIAILADLKRRGLCSVPLAVIPVFLLMNILVNATGLAYFRLDTHTHTDIPTISKACGRHPQVHLWMIGYITGSVQVMAMLLIFRSTVAPELRPYDLRAKFEELYRRFDISLIMLCVGWLLLGSFPDRSDHPLGRKIHYVGVAFTFGGGWLHMKALNDVYDYGITQAAPFATDPRLVLANKMRWYLRYTLVFIVGLQFLSKVLECLNHNPSRGSVLSNAFAILEYIGVIDLYVLVSSYLVDIRAAIERLPPAPMTKVVNYSKPPLCLIFGVLYLSWIPIFVAWLDLILATSPGLSTILIIVAIIAIVFAIVIVVAIILWRTAVVLTGTPGHD